MAQHSIKIKRPYLCTWTSDFQPWHTRNGEVELHPLLKPTDTLVPIHVEYWDRFRLVLALASLPARHMNPHALEHDARTVRQQLDFVAGQEILNGQLLPRKNWDY